MGTRRSDDDVRRPRALVLLTASVVALLVVVPLLSSCSKDSPTEEVKTDPADDVADGPAPTAPPAASGASSSSGASSGDEVDVNELIRRVDALNNETDICTLLTGQALKDVTQSNVNLTSLLTNPAGFTQLFSSLDRLFAHLVTIGPAELTSPLQTMQGVWKSMSTIDPRAADAESRSSSLIGDPAVQQAQTTIGAYVESSCATG